MARVFSTRLAVGSAIGSSLVIFTAQPGGVTVVRDISMANVTATAPIVAVGELIAAGGTAVVLAWTVPQTAGSITWTGRIVLNPGDQFGVSNTGAGRLDAVISGYFLGS